MNRLSTRSPPGAFTAKFSSPITANTTHPAFYTPNRTTPASKFELTGDGQNGCDIPTHRCRYAYLFIAFHSSYNLHSYICLFFPSGSYSACKNPTNVHNLRNPQFCGARRFGKGLLGNTRVGLGLVLRAIRVGTKAGTRAGWQGWLAGLATRWRVR